MRLSVRCFRELPDDDKYMIPDNMIPKPDEFQYDISDRFVFQVLSDVCFEFVKFYFRSLYLSLLKVKVLYEKIFFIFCL